MRDLRRLLLSATLLAGVGLAVSACSSPEQKAQAYYQRGQELLEKKDYVKAALEFKNALQLKKNMVEAWRGLLDVEVHSNNPQAVVPILRNIVDLDPKDVKAELQLGHLLLAANAVSEAQEMANKATELQPKNPDAIAFRAAVLLKQDNPVAARREAQEALDLDPKNSDAIVVLAAERVKQNDLAGAMAILNKDPAAHENDLGIQLFKLAVLEKLGNDNETEAQLKKLIGLFPKEVKFRQALVQFYLKKGNPEQAEKELRAVADADPTNVQAGIELVRLVQSLRGAEAARTELVNRIKTAGSQAFKFQLALAEFDFSQGRADEAVKQLKELSSGPYKPEEIASAQLDLARIQLAQRNLNAASSLAAEVLKQDERNIDGLKIRAAIKLDQSQYDSAINDLRQALNDQPRNSELMLLLASAYERTGSIDLAEKEYADALQASGFNPTVSLTYVAFLRRRGNLEHAEDILLEASKRSPGNIPVLSALADVRLARQNWSGARAVADQIQRINGGASIGDQILVASLNGLGQYDASIKLLENLHQASPAAVEPVVGLVNTLVRAGKPDEAIALLKSVLKETPDNAQALVLLGTVQVQQNKQSEAEATFRSAIEKQATYPGGYASLAQLYFRQSKLDEAEKALRDGLSKIPDNYALREDLAAVLEQKGEIESAIAEFEYLLKQQPGSLVTANNLASLLADYRTDKDSLNRAYELGMMLSKSPVPSFQDTLGWITYRRGDKASALKLLEVAAKALPNRAVVQYHLGVVYSATGQNAKAREQFEKALRLNPNQELTTKISAAQQKAKAEDSAKAD